MPSLHDLYRGIFSIQIRAISERFIIISFIENISLVSKETKSSHRVKTCFNIFAHMKLKPKGPFKIRIRNDKTENRSKNCSKSEYEAHMKIRNPLQIFLKIRNPSKKTSQIRGP